MQGGSYLASAGSSPRSWKGPADVLRASPLSPHSALPSLGTGRLGTSSLWREGWGTDLSMDSKYGKGWEEEQVPPMVTPLPPG